MVDVQMCPRCRLEVCLVFMLCISEFVIYWFLLFDTNLNTESIYCDINGKMFNCLNRFLQDSLLPCPIIVLPILHPKYLSTMGGISPEYYSVSHYSMEEGMVYHNDIIFTCIRLN
jgi:hypothetical protein